MPEQLQVIIDAVKDYGAAIISTLSVGGIGVVAGIIKKVKDGIESTKKATEALIAKKDAESKAMTDEYKCLLTQISDQNKKIDKLTEELTKVKK